ncbi:RING-type E3 ubiquitin transferase [Malassezia nana]|uniref:RING-type E3 ubiquitin transferase n=1 Tax=Malassezia nana TaxID=180528 RepID=A0AAF0EKA3_9BASI|nr:RING-type E3 ubiquitin transferase [Malassezia nana]
MARRTGVASSSASAHGVSLQAASSIDPSSKGEGRSLADLYLSDEVVRTTSLPQDDMECPLCLEEIDISDANFKPCPCGYQICRFCWHHIKQNLNGRCPACRRKYSDQAIEFKAMSTEEILRLTNAKKNKEREKKEMEATNRKHLANMRVVQKNLVYVVGLSPKFAREELIPTLKGPEYFGQYGRVAKILISKRVSSHKYGHGSQDPSTGVYVTYHSKEDAARAIVAIDGSKEPGGRIIRASYGTTKYCTAYLRNMPCSNPGCTYLHEPGEEADSFTKEDLATLRHAAKDTEHKIKPASMHLMPITKKTEASSASETPEGSALPRTASWATAGRPEAGSSPSLPPRDPQAFPGLASAKDHAARSTPKIVAAKTPTGTPTKGRTKTTDSGTATATAATTAATASTTTTAAAAAAATEPPAPPPTDLGSSGAYKPSNTAQELLDGLHQRRQESNATPPVMFPQADWTLASLSDGDFSFHLPSIPPELENTSAAPSALDLPGIDKLSLDVPGLDEREAPLYTYRGSFNPFDEVDGPSGTIADMPLAGAAVDVTRAPYAVAEGRWPPPPPPLWRAGGCPAAPTRVAPDYTRSRRTEDTSRPVEEQRSAAAAMLAARARQLQEAGEGGSAHSMGDVRSNLARQQAQLKHRDSQTLLALLRRIQDVPGDSAPASPALGTGTPNEPTALTPPPGLHPVAAKPSVATGLLLAQLLGSPPAQQPEAYANLTARPPT